MSVNVAFDKNKLVSSVMDPFEKDNSLVFFSEENCYLKIYNDGGHFVGTLCKPSKRKRFYNKKITKTNLEEFFDELYAFTQENNYTKKQTFDYIKSEIISYYGEFLGIDEYINKKIKNKIHNYFVRLKRFKRKAYLNFWNYFTTFTYDGNKLSESLFREKLRRCLSNLKTRRGWKYMGVFEKAPNTGRLHFHVLMYIPDGEMVGEIEKRREYSTKTKQMQTVYVNTFFEKTFGRNDFKPISNKEIKSGLILNYLIKYMSKTNERIVYSRGIRADICKLVNANEVVCCFVDFVNKFVLSDDIIDWETDIMHYTYQQVSFL